MIPPRPFKQVCKKCGFSKVITPRSDADPGGLFSGNPIVCPKCGESLQRDNNLNTFDVIVGKITSTIDMIKGK